MKTIKILCTPYISVSCGVQFLKGVTTKTNHGSANDHLLHCIVVHALIMICLLFTFPLMFTKSALVPFEEIYFIR